MRSRTTHALFLFALPSLFMLSCSSGGRPEGEEKSRRVLLPAGEIHEGWYFAGGDRVTIEGTINGDAYVAGGEVDVYGTINGDLLVAGGQVTISGTVTDDIRAAGGTIRFTGKTGKNIAAAGGMITFEKTSTVNGNLLVFGGSVQLAGSVAEEAKISAHDVSVTGTVGRSVEFAGGKFVSHRGALIGGDLNVLVREKHDVDIAEGTVQGQVEITTREPRRADRVLGFPQWMFWAKVVWAFSLLATALVLAFVFPRQLVQTGMTILARPGMTVLCGLLGLLLVPVVVLLLVGTLIGIPLALFIFGLYVWLTYLSGVSAGVVVSHWLMGLSGKKSWALYGTVVVGVLAVQVLTFIPYIGTVVMLAGLLFGLGALLLVLYDEMKVHRSGLVAAPPPAPLD
ncbi:MAG: hypothetical protein WBD30_09475 [Bacteroidota bacterium]